MRGLGDGVRRVAGYDDVRSAPTVPTPLLPIHTMRFSSNLSMPVIQSLLLVLASSAVSADAPVNPYPRERLGESTAAAWTFDDDPQGWVAEHDCTVSAADGHLKIQSTGRDPYLHRGVDLPGGRMVLKLRARCQGAGEGTVYWTTSESPRGEDKVSRFRLTHDGQWREYETHFIVTGQLTDLRIDPGAAPGAIEIDWIRLVREELHPLTIERVDVLDTHVRCEVRNHGAAAIEFTVLDRPYTIDGQTSIVVEQPTEGVKPLEAVRVELKPKDLPPIQRTVFVHHAAAQTDWIVRRLDEFVLRVARDGSLARLERDGQVVAILGPLVHRDGAAPDLKLVDENGALSFRGEGVALTLATTADEITVSIDSEQACTGPVVRVFGALEQGLLAGVEHLGRREASSSKLDVETEAHLRFAPDPMHVTMPLMAFVTDATSVAMTWSDTRLQPLFATPNFFDGTNDHYMTLRGEQIDVTIRLAQGRGERVAAEGVPLEEAILWATKKIGLPPLPESPRTKAQQWALSMRAFDGPLKTDAGWGHCAGQRWARHPYSDIASTIWRLSGRAPELPTLVRGGGHVTNDAIYFVTGRADQWLDVKSRQTGGLIEGQQSDGSYRYAGKFARGHFEDTASGICALPAAELLEYARLTGDPAALEAGVRTLDYMKRFRTPRGAQTWEVPLHTPDLLASAHLVRAYVRGYELTGNEEYLRCARQWALSGVPFVYLWSCRPVMAYATPPVLGATNWQAPMWIGLPVQWVGGVYAYALTMLAPYDDSLDWEQLARGILRAAEQMQYPDGPYAGLLPDAFVLDDQRRLPARINPSALVNLRLVLDGEVDFLSVAVEGKHRVAAPYAVSFRDGRPRIQARQGVAYQVLVDGHVVDVESRGHDTLEAP